MLDAQFVCDNLEAVRTNCRNRNVTVDLENIVALVEERKRSLQETQLLQQRQNELSKLIPKEKDASKKQELVQEGRKLREQVAARAASLKKREASLHQVLTHIPNMTPPDAPVGTTAGDNKVIARWGEPRQADFPLVDHVA